MMGLGFVVGSLVSGAIFGYVGWRIDAPTIYLQDDLVRSLVGFCAGVLYSCVLWTSLKLAITSATHYQRRLPQRYLDFLASNPEASGSRQWLLSAGGGDRGLVVGFMLGIRRGLIIGLVVGATVGFGIHGVAGIVGGAVAGVVLFIASSTVIGWVVGFLAGRAREPY